MHFAWRTHSRSWRNALALALKNHCPLWGWLFCFLGGKIPCEFYPYFFAPKTTLAASAAEVGSQNVVGYAKIDLAEGFNLIGSQFLEVGATVKDVNDFIYDGSALLGLDDEWAYQTTMRVWTGTGYVTYGWLDGEDGTNNEMPEWNNSWLLYDMSGLADITLNVGEAVWINAPTAGTVTFTK